MILVVKKEEEAAILDKLTSIGEKAYSIGNITEGKSGVTIVGGK